MLTITIF